MNKHYRHLIIDAVIIVISIVVTIILVKTKIIANLITSTNQLWWLDNFIAGIFFTSIFTSAPATAVLGTMAQTKPVVLTALIGGAGAALGDIIIFQFIKNKLAVDFLYIINTSQSEKLISIFKLKHFRWFLAFLGALVIASPLPDEIGLMMMGLSKMRLALFLPLSFILNSLGILIIGWLARAI
jgi:hypothetical protein